MVVVPKSDTWARPMQAPRLPAAPKTINTGSVAFAATAATLTILAALAFAPIPQVAATLSTVVHPSNIANSGILPAADVEGTVIGIAHYTSGGTLIFTYSTNSGTSWADRFVSGATGLTTTRRLDVTVESASIFNVWRMDTATCKSAMTRYRSTDAGFSWTATTDAINLNTAFSVGFDTCLNSHNSIPFVADFQDLGGGAVAWYYGRSLTAAGGGSTSDQYCGGGLIRHFDGTSTYTTVYTRTGCKQGNLLTSWTFTGGALFITSTSAGKLVVVDSGTTVGGTNPSGNTARLYTKTAGTWDAGLNLDDSGNPLASRAGPVDAFSATGPYIFAATATPTLYAADQVGSSSFFAYSVGQLSSKYYDAVASSSRLVIALQESSSIPTALAQSCNGGQTWSRVDLTVTNLYPSTPRVASLGSGTVGFAFQTNTGLGWQTSADASCAGESTPVVDPNAFTSWCSNPGITNFGGDPDADFGYDYTEDVDFDDNLNDIPGIADGYVLNSQESDSAYLGKGWETASQAAKVYFRISAGADGLSSVFRAHFSFDNAAPDSTSSGDGQTTGAFTDWVGARFQEDGSRWRISIIYNNGGMDPYLQYGSQVLYAANPQTPRLFSFTADVRNDGFLEIRDETSNQTILEVSNMATSGFPLLASKAEDPMYSQWFVTSGTSNLGYRNTYLDDPTDGVDSDDSTCIFWLDQPVVLPGDPGTTPPSTVPVPSGTSTATGSSTCSILCTNAETVPSGFSVGGFNALLGVLLMAGVGGGFYFIDTKSHYSMLFGVVGAAVGFFLAYAFGLFPLWLILLAVLIVAAVLVMRFRGSN